MISRLLARLKRSLSVVNFKRRIASFAWRASSSAFAQRTRPSCIQHCLPLNAWRASRPTFAVRGYPSAAFYAAELSPATHNTSRHARLRPFHVAYGQSERSMAGPRMRGLINHGSRSKHQFLHIALPLPLPWLAHLCSLKFAESSASATTLSCAFLRADLARVLRKALCSPSLPSLLPWLAPSCENATLQQRQQAQERMAQLGRVSAR